MELRTRLERLSALVPRTRLHAEAVRAMDASAAGQERWLVALSGGADSVFLLAMLWSHWSEQRSRIVAVHFNHRLRGPESEADESFCREFCAGLNIAIHVGHWNEAPSTASEDQARSARYSFFQDIAGLKNARVLFTGHQQNDIAETQFMRLARGASSGGLAAPRPVREWQTDRRLVRPLLSLARAEIQNFLNEVGIWWREDSSNAGGQYLRNRLRGTVVPAWIHACGVGALEGAALTRQWLEEDDRALETWLDRIGVPSQFEQLELQLLAGCPHALWRRALRRWRPAQTLSWTAFDHLLTLCEKGEGRCSVGQGTAVISGGLLRWSPNPPSNEQGGWTSSLAVDRTSLILPDGAELRANRLLAGDRLRARLKAGDVEITSEAVVAVDEPWLVVRTWIHGDRYRPIGAGGSAKLQDLFVNKKVPMEARTTLPVVCRLDGRIVWVPGFPPAEDSKVTDESVTAVQLTYTRGTSTVGI